MSTGGSGVNRNSDKKNPGTSKMGELVRSGDKSVAKIVAQKTLGEMDRIKKPDLKGLSKGGRVCHACGGEVHKYAEGDLVSSLSPDLSDEGIQKMVDSAPDTQERVPPSTQFVNWIKQNTANTPKNPYLPEGLAQAAPQSEAAQSPPEPTPPPEEAPQDTEEEAPQDTEEDSQQPPAQQPQPSPPTIAKAIVSPQPAAETNKAFNDDYQKMKADFLNGNIKPETYADLYGKKDTLGKIGTIFGLMMSGFGSGLSHQPNMLMDMMNKEIERDLSAQATNQGNKASFLNSMSQHYATQSQMELQKLQGQQTLANTDLIKQNAKGAILNNSMTAMQLGVLQKALGLANGLPPGPQKQNALQAVQTLSQGIDQSAAQRNAQVSQQNEKNWKQQNQALAIAGPMGATLSQYQGQRHFPGIQGQAARQLSGDDNAHIQSGIQFQKQLDNFINWTKSHSGDLSPSDMKTGQALSAELQGAYRQATHGGVYKEGEQNFIGKLIDSNPTKFFNSIRVVPSLQALSDTNKQKMDTYVKGLGFDGYGGISAPTASTPQYKEGDVIYSKSGDGRSMVLKNNKWVSRGG